MSSDGVMEVEAIYSGDSKYNRGVNSTSFSAVRANSTMSISVEDTASDKNPVVVVSLADDA